ncbi:lipid-transfer protein [Pseudomaricurvus alkylphenolicus]|uniref:lipid-transfer protein n=1 Tax=Pseudomaricurvus alkylphenolicus TaxID=1306991 RepID=UPI00141D964D|nr:lipid-transfer protein [Pseudomaricurvus alkylphenolicus]NIB38201.1 lipid-transfer protein [Pseudomaricurvus alkylphenolicus]
MNRKVLVAGVGMIPFAKPGQSEVYNVMGEKAARMALEDSGVDYKDVQQAYAGYVYGDSTCGQAALYGVGLSGIPIVNVNNNCTTGSTALYLARQAVESGAIECAIAVGFEEMRPGALATYFTDRPIALTRFVDAMDDIVGYDETLPRAPQFFGGAGKEYAEQYGMKAETFAKVQVKARQHAANNPLALFRAPLSVEEIMESAPIFGPLTKFQCCPPTCGAAAAIICSEEFARKHNVRSPVAIQAQVMTTDTESTFKDKSMMKLIGYDMAQSAADQVYEKAGIGPEDVDVVELHDCFTANEVLTYEALRLTPAGTAEKFILDGDNTYGGKVVTNPSGGLLSKGHPLGATGLAQCYELTNQLRGTADQRQVAGAKHALAHNLGLGGACVVTLYGQVN